jgi:hypothetical protein
MCSIVEFFSDGQGFVLNCLRRNVRLHHFEDQVDVLEEDTSRAFMAIRGLVAATARFEVDGNVQFGVFLERGGKFCRTFVKILIDVTTNILLVTRAA